MLSRKHAYRTVAYQWTSASVRCCGKRLFGEPLAGNGLPLSSLLQERAFGEPLASNGLPLWLHYSGFQASCHNILAGVLNAILYVSTMINLFICAVSTGAVRS
jgi:hypothetical protein